MLKAKSHCLRTLELHYAKTQKDCAGARNHTNYSVNANFLVPIDQNRIGVKSVLGETVLGEYPMYSSDY